MNTTHSQCLERNYLTLLNAFLVQLTVISCYLLYLYRMYRLAAVKRNESQKTCECVSQYENMSYTTGLVKYV